MAYWWVTVLFRNFDYIMAIALTLALAMALALAVALALARVLAVALALALTSESSVAGAHLEDAPNVHAPPLQVYLGSLTLQNHTYVVTLPTHIT